MPPAYTDEQLLEMHKQSEVTKEYRYKDRSGNETVKHLNQYEASQRMRHCENEMRRTRSQIAAYKACNNTALYKDAKTLYRAQRAQYRDLCAQMGLREQLNRVYADGLRRDDL